MIACQVGWQFDTFFVEDGDPLATKEAEEDTDLKDDVSAFPLASRQTRLFAGSHLRHRQ